MPSTSSDHTRQLPLVRLDHLWVLLALSVIAVFISLAPTSPNDFWWHLKAGELTATTGLPTTNLFAWGVPPEAPYVYQSWLGEWLFFQIYTFGGFPLVIFVRNLLGITAYTLVAYETHARSGSWRLAALASLFAAAMTINNLTTRTQNWSWVPFLVTLFVLGRYVDGRIGPRWLISLPLVMIFWVNVHGAFVMGLLLAGAFVVGETLRRILRQPRALAWYRLRPLYLVTGAMLLATLINPLGFGIFSYVQALLNDPASQALIVEWQSPTPRNLAGAAFYLGVLALFAAFGLGRRRPTITEVILVCGLAWQSFLGVRYVVWFGFAAMPIMAQSLASARPTVGTTGLPARKERGGGSVANLAVALFLLIAVLAVQPWTKPYLGLPAPYQALFVDMPGAPLLFTIDTPVAATEHLRTEPCDGRLFNEMGYGSYLAWAHYPQDLHFIDPRIELFPFELWQTYIDVSAGREVAAFLDDHDVKCVLLHQTRQAGLSTTLATFPAWERTFQDDTSEVWRRR